MFKTLNTLSPSSSEKTSSSEDTEESESEDECDSYETKHNQIKKSYQEALKYYASSDVSATKRILEQLAKDEIFTNIDKVNRTVKSDLKQLQFAILKNLAAIFADENNHQTSVDYYLKAAEICSSDVVLLYRLGVEACKMEHFHLARTAFEQGLDISPDHWMCLDKLIAVLFVLGDYANCLAQIRYALIKNPHYSRGLILKDEIYLRNPYLKSSFDSQLFDDLDLGTYSVDEAKEMLNRLNEFADRMIENSRPKLIPSVKPTCKLVSLNWLALAEALSSTYDEFDKANMLGRFVDLSDWFTAVTVVEKSADVPFSTPNNAFVERLVSTEAQNPARASPAVSYVNDNICLDSTIDSVVSESDNDAKSVTTSGGETGLDENFSVVPSSVINAVGSGSDLDAVGSVNRDSPQSIRSSSRGRGRKRKSVNSPGPGFSEAKRRSSRLIPGFYMEDPEAFGPYTTKPVSLKDHLYACLPEKLITLTADQSGFSTPFSTGRNSEDSLENKTEDEFANCEHLNDDDSVSDDVLDFLKNFHEHCLVDILWGFVRRFCNLWFKRWSPSLCRAYIKCCQCWSKHVDYSMPIHAAHQSLDFLRDVALSRLLSAELELVLYPAEIEKDTSHMEEYFSEIAAFRNTFGSEWSVFGCRVSYYRAKRTELIKSYDLSQSFLKQCNFWLKLIDVQQTTVLLLPNSGDKICKSVIDRKVETLEKRSMLNCIGLLYDRGEYQSIIDLLSTEIESNSTVDSNNGFKERYERRMLLAKSYLALNDYRSLSTCVVDALRLCLEVYRRLDYTEKYAWWPNFDVILKWSLLCLEQPENYQQFFTCCSLNSLKTFAETLIELILCALDFSGSGQRQKDAIPTSCFIDTWIVLYNLCKRLEADSLNEDAYVKAWYATSDSHSVVLTTKSLMLLDKAHEELGKKGLCMLDDGRLLLTLSEELMKSLRHPKITKYLTSSVNDDTLNCAEQCFYCLYNYPRKRSRCIVEHFAKNIPLTFDMSNLLFDFVRPETSPEFDDTSAGISAETVYLLHRIEALVPESLKPDRYLPQLEDYISGLSADLPQLDNFDEVTIIRDLYHLLADYYGKVKEKDVDKVCRYYLMDLCFSPDRGDSWAGLALHKGTIVDQTLNSLDLKYDNEDLLRVNKLASSALFCYRRVAQLIPAHAVLMVEHGSLAYSLHSYVRRYTKRICANDERLDGLKQMYVDFLLEAKGAFETASRVICNKPRDEYKEEWVLYYLLGKIAEKFNEKPSTVLQYYHRAAHCLHSDGAKYPLRLLYNAANYAYESLEIFYRVHASALKWLKNGKLTDENELLTVWKYLHMYCTSPFKAQDQTLHHGRLSAGAVEKKGFNRCPIFVDPDVVQTVEELLSTIVTDEFESRYGILQLDLSADEEISETVNCLINRTVENYQRSIMKQIVLWSLDAMQICVRRCPHCPHYKAYYWLALIYFENNFVKDRERSKRFLIGPTNSHIHALFQNLTGQNLFEGIWVIPTDDISRSGSLAAHLHKTVRLLDRILTTLGDYEHLCNLYLLLYKKPTNAKSKYLKECDRVQLTSLVLNSIEKVFKSQFNKNIQCINVQENICVKAYHCWMDCNRSLNPTCMARWNDILKWLFEKMFNRKLQNLPDALACFNQLSNKQKFPQNPQQSQSSVSVHKKIPVLDAPRNEAKIRAPGVFISRPDQQPLEKSSFYSNLTDSNLRPRLPSAGHSAPGAHSLRGIEDPKKLIHQLPSTRPPQNASCYTKSPEVIMLSSPEPSSSPSNNDITVLEVIAHVASNKSAQPSTCVRPKNAAVQKTVPRSVESSGTTRVPTTSALSAVPSARILPQSGYRSSATVKSLLAARNNQISQLASNLIQHRPVVQSYGYRVFNTTAQTNSKSHPLPIGSLELPYPSLTPMVSNSSSAANVISRISSQQNLNLNTASVIRQQVAKKSIPR